MPPAATPAATLGPPPPATVDSNRAMDDRKSGQGLIEIFVYAVAVIGIFKAMLIFLDKCGHGNSPWYCVLMYLSIFTWSVSFMNLVITLSLRFRNNPTTAPKATTCVRKGPGFKSNSKVAPSAATDVNERRLASDGHSNRAAMDDRKSGQGLIEIFVYAVAVIGIFKAMLIFLDKCGHGNSPWYCVLMYLSIFTWSVSFMNLVATLSLRFRYNPTTAPKATTCVRKGPGFKSNSKVAPSAATDVNERRLASGGHSNRAMDDRKSGQGLIEIFVYAVAVIGIFKAMLIFLDKCGHGNSPWYCVLMYLSIFTWSVSFMNLVITLSLWFRNNLTTAPKATTCARTGPGFKSNSKVAPSDVIERRLASDDHSVD